jgi:DNA-binding transcriptional LysR family regulator
MMGYNPLEVVDVEMVFDKLIPTYIIVAPNHPLASRPSVSLSDCVGYGVGLLDATSPMKQVYDTMFSRAKLRPQQLISSNSYSLLRNVAAAGMCFSFVNEHMSNPPQANGNYCYVPVRDNRVKPARFVVCVRRGRNLPVAATAFIDRLIEALPAARTE